MGMLCSWLAAGQEVEGVHRNNLRRREMLSKTLKEGQKKGTEGILEYILAAGRVGKVRKLGVHFRNLPLNRLRQMGNALKHTQKKSKGKIIQGEGGGWWDASLWASLGKEGA